jgi:hypothetical protein
MSGRPVLILRRGATKLWPAAPKATFLACSQFCRGLGNPPDPAAAHKEAHNTRNVENDFGSQNVGLECASLLPSLLRGAKELAGGAHQGRHTSLRQQKSPFTVGVAGLDHRCAAACGPAFPRVCFLEAAWRWSCGAVFLHRMKEDGRKESSYFFSALSACVCQRRRRLCTGKTFGSCTETIAGSFRSSTAGTAVHVQRIRRRP